MAHLSPSPKFWLSCLGWSRALVCFKSSPGNSNVRVENQTLGSEVFTDISPVHSMNYGASFCARHSASCWKFCPSSRQRLSFSPIRGHIPKSSCLQLKGKWRSPSASACLGPGRPRWFLNELHLCPPPCIPRCGLPPEPEHRGRVWVFLQLEKGWRVSSGLPMAPPQHMTMPLLSHSKHWPTPPLGQGHRRGWDVAPAFKELTVSLQT